MRAVQIIFVPIRLMFYRLRNHRRHHTYTNIQELSRPWSRKSPTMEMCEWMKEWMHVLICLCIYKWCRVQCTVHAHTTHVVKLILSAGYKLLFVLILKRRSSIQLHMCECVGWLAVSGSLISFFLLSFIHWDLSHSILCITPSSICHSTVF